LIGGSGPEGLTYAEAVSQLGFTADSLLDEVIEAMASADGPAMFEVIDRVVSGGHDPRRFATDLLERLRDLIVLNAAPEAASHGLVDASPDRLAVLTAQADRIGLAGLSRAADLTNEGLSELKGATAPRLQLELLVARLLLPGADDDVRGTLVRLDRVEQQLAQGVVVTGESKPSAAAASPPAGPPPKLSEVAPSTSRAATTAPAKSPAKASAAAASPVPTAPVMSDAEPPATSSAEPTDPVEVVAPVAVNDTAAATVELSAVRTMWPAVLEKLKLDSRVAWTAFERSAPVGVSGDTVTVGVPESGTLTFAKKSGHDTRLREAILAVMHADLIPDLVLDPGAVIAAAPEPAAQTVDEPPVAKAPAPADPDEPSADDPDVSDDDGLSGIALAARELGAKVVAEFDEA